MDLIGSVAFTLSPIKLVRFINTTLTVTPLILRDDDAAAGLCDRKAATEGSPVRFKATERSPVRFKAVGHSNGPLS